MNKAPKIVCVGPCSTSEFVHMRIPGSMSIAIWARPKVITLKRWLSAVLTISPAPMWNGVNGNSFPIYRLVITGAPETWAPNIHTAACPDRDCTDCITRDASDCSRSLRLKIFRHQTVLNQSNSSSNAAQKRQSVFPDIGFTGLRQKSIGTSSVCPSNSATMDSASFCVGRCETIIFRGDFW